MGLYDLFDEGEAETGAGNVVAGWKRGAIEAFKNSGLVFGRNTDAVVADEDDGAAALTGEREFNLAAGAGVLNGVCQEVLDGLFESLAVGRDVGKAGCDVDFEIEAALGEGIGEGASGRLKNFGQGRGLKLEGPIALLDSRELKDSIDKSSEAFAFAEDVLDVFRFFMFGRDAAKVEQFREGPDGSDGRTEFVRDARDKLCAQVGDPGFALDIAVE